MMICVSFESSSGKVIVERFRPIERVFCVVVADEDLAHSLPLVAYSTFSSGEARAIGALHHQLVLLAASSIASIAISMLNLKQIISQ